MSGRLFLLSTDLDRTLLPNGAAPESPGARRLFARVAAQPEVVVAYVTGRDRGRVEAAIEAYALPIPDLVVADVGTTVYDLRGGGWERWERWDEAIGPDWGGRTRADVAALLADLPDLVPQEPSRQGRFKASWHVALDADRAALDRAIATRLQGASVRAARVWSVDEAAGVGLLDVVPASATKVHALRFVAESLAVPPADVLFAGDSGNDLPVLASAIPSVLVANARPEVAAEALRLAEAAGTREFLYLARGGWRGLNGCYAAGILEGLAHYHPERLRAWLSEAVHP